MRVVIFSTKPYDRAFLGGANRKRHELVFKEPHLSLETAPLAAGADAVCLFVHDHATYDFGRPKTKWAQRDCAPT